MLTTKSPIVDREIEEYLNQRPRSEATTDSDSAYRDADLVISTDQLRPVENYFDTSSVESVIKQVIAVNPDAVMIIKSTVPVGFTEARENTVATISVQPGILREDALYDNLYPSRIIVGVPVRNARLHKAETRKPAERAQSRKY